jgi:transposase InsO family protein
MFGKEQSGYTCGSLFVDHASALAMEEGFKVKEYHSDNGIFSSAEFKEHCTRQHQKYSFSGVGVKHQSGIAERNIKTVAQWARTNMLHIATH